MKIAICEDTKKECDALCQMLESELARRSIAGEIVAFESGEAMLEEMKRKTFPINFLDIYMAGITGIEVARLISARDKNSAIVFTTSSPDHMADGYAVGAVHYLLKPYTQESVDVAFERCLRIVGTQEQFITITVNRESRRVLLSKILWAESQNKSCVIRLPDESLRVYMRLDELLTLINDARFLQCHKSFIVNLDQAAYIKSNNFIMKDGFLVPIRREERARIKELFEDYCFEKQRRGM